LDAAAEQDLIRRTLQCYHETLLREVATNLVRPRGQWPADELIERCLSTLGNPATVDRRLKGLSPSARMMLTVIGASRQACWPLGELFQTLLALGDQTPIQSILEVMGVGFLYPVLESDGAGGPVVPSGRSLTSLEQWLAAEHTRARAVFAASLPLERVRGEAIPVPDLHVDETPSAVHEADGLEWLLRLAVLWQTTTDAPLRKTQHGTFFKRDQDRITEDPLLAGPPADSLVELPQQGFFLVALAEQVGLLREVDGEWHAQPLPEVWNQGLIPTLASLYGALFRPREMDHWGDGAPGLSPSTSLLSLLLLAHAPAKKWARLTDVQAWLTANHPAWKSPSDLPLSPSPLLPFFLGVVYQLGLIQAGRAGSGDWLVRLTALGRWLTGVGHEPEPRPVFAQTLLVQPNLDIIAYRQGLTPGLIARLTHLAGWKQIGAACLLHLGPETVYRALEAGESYESIQLMLEQHSGRALPDAVTASLRTWSDKRDRITVYPSAMLLEFSRPEDMHEALARGQELIRLTDTLALAAKEESVDYKHFRLTFTRDYTLPPDQCIKVGEDGLALSVDLARADLLLETELPRLAEFDPEQNAATSRTYRLTPASLRRARQNGWSIDRLDTWFLQRTGEPLPPSARLLLEANHDASLSLSRYLVLETANPAVADGLQQWPATRALIVSRLGPTALVIDEANEALFRERLAEGGIHLKEDGGTGT
jgi:hypothetical protein